MEWTEHSALVMLQTAGLASLTVGTLTATCAECLLRHKGREQSTLKGHGQVKEGDSEPQVPSHLLTR